MRLIIGLIAFWILLIGTTIFFAYKFNVKRWLAMPIVVSAVCIITFLAALLNLLKLFVIAFIIAGGYFWIVSLKKGYVNVATIKAFFKDPSSIIILLIFVYITVVGWSMHLVSYDNFSHWALIVKSLLIDDALPNFEDEIIVFKGYQPGSALFIYLVGTFCGRAEGVMIIAQNYLLFIFILPLFNFVGGNYRWLKRTMIVAFCYFVLIYPDGFNSLLVDSLLGVMAVSAIAVSYEYRDNLQKGFWFAAIIIVHIFLVKNTGLVIAGFCGCYILYLSIINKETKEGIKRLAILIASLLAEMLIWNGHVRIAFGEAGLTARHSLSVSNMLNILNQKDTTEIITFIKGYYQFAFSIGKEMIGAFLLVLIVFFALYLCIIRSKTAIKFAVAILLTFFSYLTILCFMYIVSMPTAEAEYYACFSRYMSTIIIAIVGAIIITLLIEKVNVQWLMAIIVCGVVAITPCYAHYAKTITGTDYYKGSVLEEIAITSKELKDNPYSKYIIYESDYNKSYYYHASKYYFYSKNVVVAKDIEHVADYTENTSNPLLVVCVEDSNISQYIKSKKMTVVTNCTYEKQKK